MLKIANSLRIPTPVSFNAIAASLRVTPFEILDDTDISKTIDFSNGSLVHFDNTRLVYYTAAVIPALVRIACYATALVKWFV